MADWPLKHDGPCACRFVRREEFGEAEQTEWCGRHAALRDELERKDKALLTLAKYFTSGNHIPVDQATIKAADFWNITGLTVPNAAA